MLYSNILYMRDIIKGELYIANFLVNSFKLDLLSNTYSYIPLASYPLRYRY